MTRQCFYVEDYWKVVVYYDVDHDFLDFVFRDFNKVGVSRRSFIEMAKPLLQGKAKAFTYSNLHEHISIVLFSKHRNRYDHLNSLVHEAEHIKQAMLKAYLVKDEDELPAYTIGYLVMRMWEVFQRIFYRLS